jgi:predicted nucleic acid-binding protein
MTLADTSFVIDLLRGHNAAADRLGELLVGGYPLYVSTVTLLEIERGLIHHSVDDGKHRRAIEDLSFFNTIPVDSQIARIAGRIQGRLTKEGQSLPTEDCIIAATSQRMAETLLTSDRHFERIPDLVLEFHR